MKIKKSRLMQIIQEEISRMNEVEVVRRSSRKNKEPEDELELWNQWKTNKDSENEEDKKKAAEAFAKLYIFIRPKIENFLKKKKISTLDDSTIEDYAQDVFLKVIENPELFQGRSKLSTFLQGNSNNKALDRYRKVVKTGGTPTSTGQTTAQSDILQQDDNILDVMGGSRFPDPEKQAIARDSLEKLKLKIKQKGKDNLSTYFGHRFGEDGVKMSQKEAAAELGVSQATGSRLESEIGKISKQLGLDDNVLKQLGLDDNVYEGKERGGINLEETIKAAIMEMIDEGAFDRPDVLDVPGEDYGDPDEPKSKPRVSGGSGGATANAEWLEKHGDLSKSHDEHLPNPAIPDEESIEFLINFLKSINANANKNLY